MMRYKLRIIGISFIVSIRIIVLIICIIIIIIEYIYNTHLS